MFKNILRHKPLLAALTLLITLVAGAGVFISLRPGAMGKGASFISEAFQAVFGGPPNQELDASDFLYSSSTLLAQEGQENNSAAGPAGLPPLLIEGQTDNSSKTSNDLKVALDKGLKDAGLPPAASGASTGQQSAATPFEWCSFEGTGLASRIVLLNEVAWMGSLQNPNEEWLEIKNVGAQVLDLQGWQIQNQKGSIKMDLSSKKELQSDKFLVLRRDGETYSGALNNSGDYLKIFDADCKVVDELDAVSDWPAGDNVTKKTLERNLNGGGWHTSAQVGGSPGAQNSEVQIPANNSSSSSSSDPAPATSSGSSSNSGSNATASTSSDSGAQMNTIPTSTSPSGVNTNSPSSTQSQNNSSANSSPSTTPPAATTTQVIAHLVIYSVQITGGEGMADQDYIEIFNPTAASVDISDWKLRKRTQGGTESSIKVFPAGSVIHSGGYFSWANSANNFNATVSANVSSTQILASDNSIALMEPGGAVVDALAWGAGHTTPYIEGSAYPENSGPGQRLTRRFEGGQIKDSGNNAEDFELRQ